MDTNTDTTDSQKTEMQELLEHLEAETPVPEAVTALDTGKKDAQGPASHAFSVERRKQKEAAALIRKQQEELEVLKKGVKPVETQTQAPQPPTQNASVADRSTLLRALVQQAMTNLQVYQIATPEDQRLVDLEVQRLYSQIVETNQRMMAAQQTAPGIVQSKLEKYMDRLGEAGIAEVKKRLGQYSVLQQTDDSLIHSTVANYLGELALSGSTTTGSQGNQSGSVEPISRPDPSIISAGSSVKNGRQGFTVQGGDTKKQAPKPATAEESEEMRKLKMSDLAAYRAAKAKKSMYMGR